MWRLANAPTHGVALAATVPALAHMHQCNSTRKRSVILCGTAPQHTSDLPRMSWHEARQAGFVDDIPGELVQALKQGRCVAQVGAGVSMSAGLPGFEALLVNIASSGSVAIEVPKSGSYGDLDHIQSFLTEHLGRETMCRLMEEQLRVPKPMPQKAEILIRAFCSLPFAAVLSWNWDEMLDDQLAVVSHNDHGFRLVLDLVTSRPGDQNSTEFPQGPLVKFQGSLRDPTRVILDKSDYDRRSAPLTRFLHQLQERQVSMLYIGLSLRWEKENAALPISGGVHFAVLNDVPPTRRHELLQNHGIRVISYSSKGTNFEGNRIVLEELARRLAAA
mmetsp:Transcript_104612/g.181750  ORF Transcript_104612/g.181750 Transcript_104612/m.181750 type:complete len:332 (-) Transcript_104612:70-1065(-)